MTRQTLRRSLLAAVLVSSAGVAGAATPPAEDMAEAVTQGALRVKREGGVVECPLKHTDVDAMISGFIARVTVTQTFLNPFDEKIEAAYVFPLPHKAAVDDMTMVIGERRIVGVIKRRAAAREIYEQALAQGATAALLEQERPNIFTQSVGNIEPGGEIRIEISYLDVLEYDMGTYSFHFPMVVGPRYIPGTPATAVAPAQPDTDRVPDASRITPPVLKPGFRNGHDIALSVALHAGVPIRDLRVTSHEAAITRGGEAYAEAVMSPADSIPNKDFVLKYDVVGDKPEMATFCYRQAGEPGYFMLMIQPRDDERLHKTPPRELSFLIDVSGSMSGRPTEKVKDVMRGMLQHANAQDTVQVVTFAGSARKLFEGAVPADEGNIARALDFTRGIRAGGGTEMLKGVKMAINDPLDEQRVRIVIMLTDGYIGNEAEIIAEVGRRCGDRIRFWCLGMGNSVNRFLVDGVARQGGGMAKMLGLNDDAAALAQEIMFRIHRAQLAGIEIDWGALAVTETYPARIPELWAGRPVILFGRYQGGGETTIQVRGKVEGEPAAWPLSVAFPDTEPGAAVLATVWARHKIEDLMQQTYYAGSPEVEEEVTGIALQYRLMSQYTSFVAVDESTLGSLYEPARPPRRMLVPVPIPDGTRYEGFFGHAGYDTDAFAPAETAALAMPAAGAPMVLHALSANRPSGRPRMKSPRRNEMHRQLSAPPTPAPAGRMGGRYFAEMEDSHFGGIYAGRTADLGMGYTQHALRQQRKDLVTLGAKAREQAEAFRKEGDLAGARSLLAWACLLDKAAGGETDKTTEALQDVDRDLLKRWAAELPALERKLDLELRHATIESALQEIARAAGLSVRLLPGSAEDTHSLISPADLEIPYMDLRGAKTAQTLDWLLHPARLSWWVDGKTVVAGSARRGPAAQAWVYDVSAAALPDHKEIEGIEEQADRVKAAEREAGAFLSTVRKELGLEADRLCWYEPGKLLVYAPATIHAAAGKLFAQLADPVAEVPASLQKLHARTAPRAEARRESRETLDRDRERARVRAVLNARSWGLLAGAVGGRLDAAAFLELEAAWNSPHTAGLLARADPAAFRAAWAFAEAARQDAQDLGASAVWKRVAASLEGPAADAVTAFGKQPESQGTLAAALYGALALHHGTPLQDALAQSDLTLWKAIAATLLQPGDEAAAKTLATAFENTEALRGPDLVGLLALACRHAGGQAWLRMRAEAREILGRQPLPGGLVVMVNRIGAQPQPALAR